MEERSGDFSNSLQGIPRDPTTGQPFTDGVIPPFFIHPIGRAIAALYPLPNRSAPFANFVSSPTQRDDNDHFDARVDHFLSNASTLVFRYSFGDRRFFEPFAGPTLSLIPGYGNEYQDEARMPWWDLPRVLAQAGERRALRFQSGSLGSQPENQGTSVNRALGLPELSPDVRDFGLSFITVTGFSPLRS